MIEPRYSSLLGKFSFTSDQMRETGCSREEAERRWDEMSGCVGRSHAIARLVETAGVSRQDAVDAVLFFENDMTSAGEVVN